MLNSRTLKVKGEHFNSSYQQIKYEIDPEYLFSPISGEGKQERRIVESYFKVNYTHRFNVGRITRPGETSLKLNFNRLLHNAVRLRWPLAWLIGLHNSLFPQLTLTVLYMLARCWKK